MRIAIDASRTTVSQRTGTENYALQLLRALLALESPHHYTLYFRDVPPPDLFPKYPQVTEKVIPFKRLWTHGRLATELWRTRPDLTFVPAHTLPRFFPGKALVTVHDLGYLYFPAAHPPQERRYLDWSTRYSARRATTVLADSLATKNDLIQHYRIPAEKIAVVYPGMDETLAPVTDAALLQAMRAKYNLPARYLLFIGTLQPRKNIARLVQAFDLWRKNSAQQEVVLALAGKAGWLYDPQWVAGVENVQVLGYIADADIAALYSGAIGLVFPSLFEGFGFPVLEAMRCQIPVLCSNTSSLPELGGEAALLVDPLSVEAISAGIGQLVENEALRQQLIEKGQAQVQKFTWARAARQVLDIL